MRLIFTLLTAAALGLPIQVHADSDGYFCAGPGYLAFETRLAPGAARHELHIVRFSSADGIAPEQRVVLEEFQVHAMDCRPAEVLIAAWDLTYAVDLRESSPSVRVVEGGNRSAAAHNLGYWSRPLVIDLDAAGEDRFQLVIARVSQQVPGGLEHHVVSRLIQRGAQPHAAIIRSRQLFEGVFLETVD